MPKTKRPWQARAGRISFILGGYDRARCRKILRPAENDVHYLAADGRGLHGEYRLIYQRQRDCRARGESWKTNRELGRRICCVSIERAAKHSRRTTAACRLVLGKRSGRGVSGKNEVQLNDLGETDGPIADYAAAHLRKCGIDARPAYGVLRRFKWGAAIGAAALPRIGEVCQLSFCVGGRRDRRDRKYRQANRHDISNLHFKTSRRLICGPTSTSRLLHPTRMLPMRVPLRHSKNCRRCVDIFLKKYHPSLMVFENVDPFILCNFAASDEPVARTPRHQCLIKSARPPR